jgi:hypothetical protein
VAKTGSALPPSGGRSDVAPIHNRQMVVLERPDWLVWLDLISHGRNPRWSNRFDNPPYRDRQRGVAVSPDWSLNGSMWKHRQDAPKMCT